MIMNHRDYRINGPVMLLAAALVVAGSALPAAGQSCEVPLFVMQSMTGANVMILADNSGSMNAGVYHLDYDPDVVYSGNFTAGYTYFVSKSKTYTPSSFNLYWPTSPGIYLVSSDNGEDGRYDGNYLNWMFFHTTAAQQASIPPITRIQVLKVVLKDIITRSQRLNFGLTVFQYDHGGSIIGKCGVTEASLQAQIDGITANTWTPLGESMETILDYFSYDGPDAVIQSPCQYNFVLVVTDGEPTMDLDVSPYLWDADHDGNDPGNCTSIGSGLSDYYDCSDHFDDIAYYMFHEDLRPDLDGQQNVITYVVGFHENISLLPEAAKNGDGLFFEAENAVDLYLSMEYAIQDILRRISAGSAVAVVSTERGTDDRLYRGKFMPLDWVGYLESYDLPYATGDQAVWEAGELLRARPAGDRDIFTAIGSTKVDFVTNQAGTLQPYMNVASASEADTLISWAQGTEFRGAKRFRNYWKLGDIVHATPVVVGAPSDFVLEESYQKFYEDNKARQRVVYVGANDGMMHAFDAESGKEEWAFVPQFALPDFVTMADTSYCHVYTCDQTATVKDVELGGVWHTIMVAGGREGGSGLFALDITEPANPKVMWQVDLPNAKSYNSEVKITSIDGNPVAIVGSGLDEATGEAWVYGYDVESGNLLGSLLLSSSARVRNKTTTPAVLDRDMDGNADVIYVADLLGSLWRLEVSGYTNPNNWGVTELYTKANEITSTPTIAYGENGETYVYFGTGAYLTEADMTDLTPQRFYCVIDRGDGSTYNYKSLEDQTSTIHDVNNSSGWYIDLWNETGERVTETAVVVAETVIFTSYAPTQAACVGGGSSYLYQMDYRDGSKAKNNPSDNLDDRSVSLGDGVASYPVVDLSSGTVVVQSSDAEIHINDIQAPITRMTVRSWQESYDNVVMPAAQGGAIQ